MVKEYRGMQKRIVAISDSAYAGCVPDRFWSAQGIPDRLSDN
jgi:hypothetical protein